VRQYEAALVLATRTTHRQPAYPESAVAGVGKAKHAMNARAADLQKQQAAAGQREAEERFAANQRGDLNAARKAVQLNALAQHNVDRSASLQRQTNMALQGLLRRQEEWTSFRLLSSVNARATDANKSTLHTLPQSTNASNSPAE
jgi:hypothetical protein